MKVLMIEPGRAPYVRELNGLAEMQEAVGGTIQAIYPFREPVAIVCNDDGLLLQLPFNRSVPGGYGGVFGPFFICGLGEEDFCSLTDEQIEAYNKMFYPAEILIGVHGDELLTVKCPPEGRWPE